MKNGHLTSHVAWIAYKHQLWPGLQYELGTMTNNMEVDNKLLYKADYKMLNILGIFQNISTGLRKLHTTFGGFGLFSLPTKQLISCISMLLQHCIHKLESEAGHFALVFATSIRHTIQSADAGLHEMGTSCPTLMGQNALEVSTPFQYLIMHVLHNNT
jgi:hypothetical protein